MALTPKQRVFVDEYLRDFNATRAAITAGYSEKTAHATGWENLRKPEIREAIDQRMESIAMGRDERLKELSDIARAGEKDTDRIKAIELLGKLAGDYTQKVDQSGRLTVVIEYADDDSADD
jgi:phage terminase small subunit